MLNKYLKLILLLTILVFSGLFIPTSTWSQSEGEGEAEIIKQRMQSDQEQTKLEAEKLSELQQKDYEQCVAEANGSSPNQPGNPGPSENPQGDSTPAEPGSGWNEEDENQVRERLAAAGIEVNKKPCRGVDYHQVTGGCTDVAGLPESALQRLEQVARETGGFTLTGGTEPGHSSHGIGNPIVDISFREQGGENFGNWVYQNTTGTVRTDIGDRHQLNNGDQITREGDHWHWVIKGGGSSTTALKNKTVKYAQLVTNWLRSWFLPTAQASNANNQIVIGDNLIDVEAISGPELETMFLTLSESELNNIFSYTNMSNIRTIANKLPFEGINHTISNLTPDNLNRVVGSLGQNDLGRMISNLTSGGDIPGSFGSIDSLFSQLSSGNLNNLINSLDNNALNTAFSVLNQGSLDKIFDNLSGGMVNNLIGRLGQGSLNSIFNQISGGSLDQIIGNLGMTPLNNLFKQVSGFGLNNIFDSLGGNVLNNIFPSLSQSTLTNIFNTTAPEILNDALGQMAPDLVSDIASRLPADLVEDLADKIPELAKALPGAGIILPGPLGEIGGIITGGLYVPVVEQNGQLMQLTKSIDTTEKQIKDLSVQICTHLKAIRRIQSRFEQKMVEDADVARVKATEIEKYRAAMIDAIKKGRNVLDENGQEVTGAPLFVTNNKGYIEAAAREGTSIAIDDLSQNVNINNYAVFAGLRSETSFNTETGPTPEDIQIVTGITKSNSSTTVARGPLDRIPVVSSLLRPLRQVLVLVTGNKAFAAPPLPDEGKSNGDFDQFWTSFLKIVEKNPGVSYLRARDYIEQKRNESILAARDEALQGQGFLPVRTCVEKTSDGKNCVAWGTIQPGIIVKESGAAALNSRLTQYENADSIAEIGQGNEPDVTEILTMTISNRGGGAPGPAMVTPDNIPQQSEDRNTSEPNVNTPNPDNDEGGGDNGSGNGDDQDQPDFNFPGFPNFPNQPNDPNNPQNNSCESGNWLITGLINLLNTIFANNDTISSQYIDPLTNVLSYLANNNCKNQPPFLHFGYKKRDNGNYNLYWFSPNATLLTGCKTKNDWVNGDEIIKTRGSNLLVPWGNINVATSTTATVTTYQIECSNSKGATSTTIVI